MYEDAFWEDLLDYGDLYDLYDAYVAHEAQGLPVPVDVITKLDEAGYKVTTWKDKDDE